MDLANNYIAWNTRFFSIFIKIHASSCGKYGKIRLRIAVKKSKETICL